MDEEAQKWNAKMLSGAEFPLLAHPIILLLENPVGPTPAVESHWCEEALPNYGCGLLTAFSAGPE